MDTKLRVLIAEDSEDDALLLVRMLRKGGYEPDYERVDSPQAMSDALDNRVWDAIVSDYVMPQFSGLDALKLVQSKGLDLPFIIVSGNIGEEIAVEAMRVGAHDYIMKSNLMRLVPAIGRELHEAEVRRKRRKAEEELGIRDAAIASSVGGFAMADLTGQLTYVNRAFLDLWGYDSEEEVIGRSITEFWQSSEEAAAIMNDLQKNGSWIGEMVSRRKDDSSCYIYLAASTVFNDQGQPICIMGSFMDITERKMAEERRLELEQHKRDFYRRTILAATGGKLVICERDEIERLACHPIASWEIASGDQLSGVRQGVKKIAADAGMDADRIADFILAVGELSTNAVKHAGQGEAKICHHPESLMFVVSDSGPGIEALVLPEVAFVRGYSTAGTLGMGYKAVLAIGDRVFLATGPSGTTVGVEISIKPPKPEFAFDAIPDIC